VDGSINLPATFQFSPATSKSIDIPGLSIVMTSQKLWDKWCKILHSRPLLGLNFIIETSFFVLFFSYFQQLFKIKDSFLLLSELSVALQEVALMQKKFLFYICT
jgi:hypothetical protein